LKASNAAYAAAVADAAAHAASRVSALPIAHSAGVPTDE
jgi:hypothetical protein